jgi:hypothetical protein
MKAILAPKDDRAFQVNCTASPVGSFRAGVNSLSVTIGQRIRRLGGEEMWDSVTIQCREECGERTVRVLVCHPDWDGPLQIACIRSQPSIDVQTSDMGLLRCDLEHIQG